MIVHVNTGSGTCELVAPDDFGAFHVGTDTPDASVVGAALGDAGTANAAPAGHVWISVDWLRAQVDGGSDQWNAGFEKMIAYAASKGWMNSDGTMIQAHIQADATEF